VRGLDNTLRLLAIDTEETFKHEENAAPSAAAGTSTRRAAAAIPSGQ
jgi:hypothetical protein